MAHAYCPHTKSILFFFLLFCIFILVHFLSSFQKVKKNRKKILRTQIVDWMQIPCPKTKTHAHANAHGTSTFKLSVLISREMSIELCQLTGQATEIIQLQEEGKLPHLYLFMQKLYVLHRLPKDRCSIRLQQII